MPAGPQEVRKTPGIATNSVESEDTVTAFPWHAVRPATGRDMDLWEHRLSC